MSTRALKLVVAIKIYRNLSSRDLAMKFISEYGRRAEARKNFKPKPLFFAKIAQQKRKFIPHILLIIARYVDHVGRFSSV